MGQWDIHEFHHKGKDLKDYLIINYIMFYNDNTFAIPEILEFSSEDTDDQTTSWAIELIKDDLILLKLNCNNPIFKGTYQVKFFKDEKLKLLGISLTSNSTKIIAYKALQDFHSDGLEWEQSRR